MAAALYTLYYINSAFLILVVLLQSGRGGGLGEFGGGSSSAVFGSRGASTLLQKLTVYSATTFMVLSLALAIFSSRQSDVGRGEIVAEEQLVPSLGAGQDPALPPASAPPASDAVEQAPVMEELPQDDTAIEIDQDL